jgi:hypothetical protein
MLSNILLSRLTPHAKEIIGDYQYASDYAIRRVQVNKDGLKLKGTHQLLVYAEDINILGGSIHTIKKNSGALVVASKETGLEVNADKTKYMVMSWDQNSG